MMSVNGQRSTPSTFHAFQGFSVIISAALELLGYSYSAITARQAFFGSMIKSSIPNVDLVGSKAEGTTLISEGDMDLLNTSPFGCFADDAVKFTGPRIIPRERLYLVCEKDSLFPGYARIRIVFPNKLHLCPYGDFFNKIAFKSEKGHYYLSSLRYFDLASTAPLLSVTDQEPHGPAFTRFNTDTKRSNNIVITIPYKESRLMSEWRARPRNHGWPSQETQEVLSNLDWDLVPVGPKNTETSQDLFKICFTLGEVHLLNTFNTTQLHLLILLKFVMAKSLKEICSDMSSYIAKNIVFWIVETIAPENFKVKNLSSLLMLCLQMLRDAVENEHLENYMIPSRNILQGKMSVPEKNEILKRLDRFLDDGPAFLTKHEYFVNLKEAMQVVNDDPAKAKLLSIIRDEGEKGVQERCKSTPVNVAESLWENFRKSIFKDV